VMEKFQYDPFAHLPRERCTVGALRAQAKDVDVSFKSGGGGKPPSDYEKGFVTIGDIMKQLAEAYAVPWGEEARP
jgi:hypothetical protein